jgi:hypothetical protein
MKHRLHRHIQFSPKYICILFSFFDAKRFVFQLSAGELFSERSAQQHIARRSAKKASASLTLGVGREGKVTNNKCVSEIHTHRALARDNK